MAVTKSEQKKLLNNLSPGAKKAGLGDIIENLQAGTQAATEDTAGVVKQGAAVADATDNASAITQLNALLEELRTAGVIASA